MQHRTVDQVPPPSPRVIDVVRATCATLPDDSTLLAEHFYDHLFRLAPDIRPMFAADMTQQQIRMSEALLDVVRNLDQPQEIQAYLRDLGAHHYRVLGVEPAQYRYVGWALVRAVGDLSNSWSSHTGSAWVLVYEWITANMLAGAQEAAERSRMTETRRTEPARERQTDPGRRARTR
ncbi:hemoglobin-like flavoprotein [Murinocardiopsis flavida]|uniref:Hemoglobin-like flavoprotein n=1 Tax=Murinocardiopsis flavida TaxID=645275 RepID=A0A2P8D3R5_9ACTN|nr:globin domain-containing protein [Murinocardiopsis flavida]PSK91852.1 hemoglobin-like flavoprotein [Murinocardiopsis flavida]